MDERLTAYIASLFAFAPRTQETAELQEELTQNSLDKLHDLIAEGMEPEAAFRKTVEGIGDISALTDASGTDAPQGAAEVYDRFPAFLPSVPFVPIAVILYILSVIPCILMQNEQGAALMFVIVAAATGLLVFRGRMNSPLRAGSERLLSAAFLAAGVAMQVLSVIPVLLWENDAGVALLLVIVAIGVGLIIVSNYIPQNGRSRNGRSQNGRSRNGAIPASSVPGTSVPGTPAPDTSVPGTPAETEQEKSGMNPVKWDIWNLTRKLITLVTVVFYIWISLRSGAWELTWLIFPISSAIKQVVRNVLLLADLPDTVRVEMSARASDLWKPVRGLLTAFSVAIYLWLSIRTGAWLITWLVFPIAEVVKQIVRNALTLIKDDRP